MRAALQERLPAFWRQGDCGLFVAVGRCHAQGPKNFWNFLNDFHEPVYLFGRVVKIELGARGGLDSELAHKGLRAWWAAAQGDAALVCQLHQSCACASGRRKLTIPARPTCGPNSRTLLSPAKFAYAYAPSSISCSAIVLPADGVEIIHCGRQPDGAANVRRAGSKRCAHVSRAFLVFDVENRFRRRPDREALTRALPPAVESSAMPVGRTFVSGRARGNRSRFPARPPPVPGALSGVHQRGGCELAGAGARSRPRD